MTPPLLAIPQMSLEIGEGTIWQITRCQLQFADQGLALPRNADSPDRFHLTTSRTLELRCVAYASDPPQGMAWLGQPTTCRLHSDAVMLESARAVLREWSLVAEAGQVREEMVWRLEDWQVTGS